MWNVGPPHHHLLGASLNGISLLLSGALKATGGRGLQPALDFLFENESKPTPTDLGGVKEQKSAAGAGAGAPAAEDDEDAAAIREVYGIQGEGGGASGEGGEGGGVAQVTFGLIG